MRQIIVYPLYEQERVKIDGADGYLTVDEAADLADRIKAAVDRLDAEEVSADE